MTVRVDRFWRSWKSLAERAGNFQARILFTLFYVLISPLGLAMRLFGDPLRLRKPSGSFWGPKPSGPRTLEEARKQF